MWRQSCRRPLRATCLCRGIPARARMWCRTLATRRRVSLLGMLCRMRACRWLPPMCRPCPPRRQRPVLRLLARPKVLLLAALACRA